MISSEVGDKGIEIFPAGFSLLSFSIGIETISLGAAAGIETMALGAFGMLTNNLLLCFISCMGFCVVFSFLITLLHGLIRLVEGFIF